MPPRESHGKTKMNEESGEKKKIDLNFNIAPNTGEGLQGGLNALGQVFEGIVGAIKEAAGPELMKGIEVASCLGGLSECLDTIASGLKADGNVPAEAAGQLTFLVEQFDDTIAGSQLESRRDSLSSQLQTAQQAIANAADDPNSAADSVAKAAGYFKAAAASCMPVPQGSNSSESDSGSS